MATTDFLPRFFKVFISLFSKNAMMIPVSYNDQLPCPLPKTAILQGSGGRSWNVAVKIEEDQEVYFEQGWIRFVEDNAISDGDFLTFVYNGDRIFDVSIFRLDGDKVTRDETQVDQDKENNTVISLSSEDDSNVTCSIPAMKNPIPDCTDKGKSKVVELEDSDEEEEDDDGVDSSSSEDTDTDSGSEFKMTKTIQSRNKNTGKMKKVVVESSDEECDNDSDSDYAEDRDKSDDDDDLVAFEEHSNSDTLYAPDNEDTATSVIPKVPNPKTTEAAKRRKKVDPLIMNPENYLDDPRNIYFETNVKNRLYELLVHAQLVKDYCLVFGDHVDYIDRFGKFRAKTAKWKDQRVCIKKWMRICSRNKLKKGDRVLCELLREHKFVYAIKLHIIREKNLLDAVN